MCYPHNNLIWYSYLLDKGQTSQIFHALRNRGKKIKIIFDKIYENHIWLDIDLYNIGLISNRSNIGLIQVVSIDPSIWYTLKDSNSE